MMLNPMRALLMALLAVLLHAPAAIAQDSAGAVMPLEFQNDEQRLRYQHFSKILRCPMCQNQNLSGSDAGIASDLRKTLHRLITESKSDQEIIDFMQSRYGNFILYEPPVNRATVVLWFGPALLLLIGLFIARRLAKPDAVTGAAKESSSVQLSEEDKQRARQLLAGQQNEPKSSGESSS